MNNILVTVIIPTYNSSIFIKKAIDSVLCQKHKVYELIIIDDGSIDDTVKICEDYKNINNLRIIKNTHCGNIAYLRNIAAMKSNGDYLAFLDSDDIWEADKLKEQIKYVEDFNFICSNASIIDENGNLVRDLYFLELKEKKTLNLLELLNENYIITSSVLVSKKIFLKYGLFDEEYGNLAEDYSLWLKIAEENNIKYLGKSLVKYRMHKKNISLSDTDKREDILKKTIRLRSKYLYSNNTIIKKNARVGIFKIYRELSVFYLYNNKFYKSLKSMIQSIRFYEIDNIKSFVNLLTLLIKIIVLKLIGRLRY